MHFCGTLIILVSQRLLLASRLSFTLESCVSCLAVAIFLMFYYFFQEAVSDGAAFFLLPLSLFGELAGQD